MKSIIAAETEKCLNSMKELLAKQGQNKDIVIMTVTKMAGPRMVTGTVSEVIEESKVDIMLQDKYNFITAMFMDTWAKNAKTKGYLKMGDNRPQYHLCKDSKSIPRILYQCNIMSQFHSQ